MDDSCAVCADNLEWVAYGACGHREVCSTCVARLCFICGDRRCCICKTESCIIFVTKALGDYTRVISDFSIFSSEVREGQVGSFWYHEDTQAFFDDIDHYKMIKAMCRLSCSVCDKMEEQSNDGPKRRARFRNIEQLKGHLYHQHRLHMCSLCLEGRKVFICEQKLYTRTQLNQHTSTGDSKVDGSESERGGFMGHPMCEFCKTSFYGDNELYSHMSTEHYNCHICQRQHPRQYEYYKNYDDLEIHFRREHYLCEDEVCLAKKFVVFLTEAEMKRHNAIEHGGRMSRSKRNAALQIPTSFRYRRNSEQESRRGRGRTFRREHGDDEELSIAIQASIETARTDSTFRDQLSSSIAHASPDNLDTYHIDPIIQPFESLTTADAESSSRYLQALGHNSRNVPLEESSFPPLPIGPSSTQQKPKSNDLHDNSMAAHLRRQNKKKINVKNSGPAWPATSRGPIQASNTSTSSQFRPVVNVVPTTSSNTGSLPAVPSYPSSSQTQYQVRPAAVHGLVSAGSPWNLGTANAISHSASASNLAENRQLEHSDSGFPPVSATQKHMPRSNCQALLNVEDVHTANKSLVEKMRSALEYNEEKYTAFKDISGRYRQGLIDTITYLDYVKQYGLSHLVIELAKLCPDAQKQKELVETYNASLRNDSLEEHGWSKSTNQSKDSSASKKKGKVKAIVSEDNSKDVLADSVIDMVKKVQTTYKPSEEEIEVLSKDGYRTSKGKSNATVDEQPVELNSDSQLVAKPGVKNVASSAGGRLGDGGGGSKQRKKTSKFHKSTAGRWVNGSIIRSKKF